MPSDSLALPVGDNGIRRAVLEADAPALNPTEHGWQADHSTRTLLPVSIACSEPAWTSSCVELAKLLVQC